MANSFGKYIPISKIDVQISRLEDNEMDQSLKCGKKGLTPFCVKAGNIYVMDQSLKCGKTMSDSILRKSRNFIRNRMLVLFCKIAGKVGLNDGLNADRKLTPEIKVDGKKMKLVFLAD